MVITVAEVSAVISLSALGTAIYGIFERGAAAKRAERTRLTTIVENTAKARGELMKLAGEGVTTGNTVEIVHAQQELLAQQARSLIKDHRLTITSTEFREMALAFEEVGFIDFADEMWLNACVKGEKEGNVQELYSRRGYAWFLFRQQQVDDAREIIREALAKVTTETDRDRLVSAETLGVWINWEIGISGGAMPVVVELGRRIDELIAACVTARGRHLVSAWAWPASPAVDGERRDEQSTAAVTTTSAVDNVTPSNPRGSAVDARHDAQADSLS